MSAPELAHLCRHPIKAIGFEELASIALEPGRAMPFDRHWAVAHAGAILPESVSEWAAKSNFLRGVQAPELMAVTARLDEAARNVTLTHPREGAITVAPDDPADAARLLDWLEGLWPFPRLPAERIISVPGQALTDWQDPFVSVLNLSSNRALSERAGMALSIHRWRGNLWLDGLAPWEEFDLIGREISVGPVRLKVEQRITRCRATMANPETGRRDIDTLATLERGYGHHDFGVYATVLEGGELRPGDKVELA